MDNIFKNFKNPHSDIMKLKVEFFKMKPQDPIRSVTFDILGGTAGQSYELYTNQGRGVDFPHILNSPCPPYCKKLQEYESDYRYRTSSFFDKGELYTMIVVQRDSAGTIIAHSDLCTFYMNGSGTGIYGNQYKYLPNYPDPSGPIVATGPHITDEYQKYRPTTAQLNNWLGDTAPNGVQWYNNLTSDLKAKYEDPSTIGFYERNPYYLKFTYDKEAFAIIDDNVTDPNDTYKQVIRCIEGIIRTEANLSLIF